MSCVLNDEQFRVTSIPFNSSNFVIFTGVPIKKDSYRVNSGKYFVSVKIDPNSLPVQPALGQHWSVKGARSIGPISTGDYQMQQHTYENPVQIECQLPESGEQLIRFISKEKDFKGIGESKARDIWRLLGKEFHIILRHDSPESRERLRSVLSEDSIDALFAVGLL